MKLKTVILALALALLANCNSGPDQKVIRTEEIIDNVFTLEITFGADEQSLPDEYLLAGPRGIIVADNGDIIVSDERRLKVFDSSGNPKRIIGRPGQGPGEFGRLVFPCISETGYITVINPMNNPHYNLFKPDYSFVERKNLQNSELHKKLKQTHNWYHAYFNMIFSYSPEEKLIYTQADGKLEGNVQKSYFAIIYQKGEHITTIANYESEDWLEASYISNGSLEFTLLPGRKIVYMHTGEHRYKENDSWYYSMFIHDLKTHEQEEIKRLYSPVTIPDSVIYPKENTFEGMTDAEKLYKERSKKLKKAGVYSPVQALSSDGDFLFAVTYEYHMKKGYVVDVFDVNSKQYLRSIYFPFISSAIKNGYAYRLKTGSDIFPEVEKYKVNPAVYGK